MGKARQSLSKRANQLRNAIREAHAIRSQSRHLKLMRLRDRMMVTPYEPNF